MQFVRPAALAGTFYPAKTSVLRAEVARLLARAESADEAAAVAWPKAIIVRKSDG
jgi:predicted class III extradiol MEMO1 family dioxygenase